MHIKTKDDLEALINGEIVETTDLEYKAADAIEKKSDIGIDVSAMANAAGGIIIYGMFCVNNKPTAIDPIKNYKQETLEQVIASQTRPAVPCHIHPIEHDGGLVLIVNVEPGQTAHQAKVDGRYHRRRNVTTYWMEDYEIRDIMNRGQHAKVVVAFSFEHDQLVVTLRNDGQVLARNIRCLYNVPKHFLDGVSPHTPIELIRNMPEGDYEYYLFDLEIDRVLHSGLSIKIESHTMTGVMYEGIRRKLSWPYETTQEDGPFIYWTVHADNAKAISGKTSFYDCLNNSKKIV